MVLLNQLSKRCGICLTDRCLGTNTPFIIKNPKIGRKLYESSCNICKRYLNYRPLSEWHFTCHSCKNLNSFCLFCKKEKPIERKNSKWCSNACSTKTCYYRYHEKNKIKKRSLIKKIKISKEYSREYQAKRKKDPQYRLMANMRSRMSISLKRNTKISSIYKYIGIDIKAFYIYIETLFQEGMSWENYGYKTWHLDHILPLSSFDLSNDEELYKVWNYKNLQPLWAKDNLSKGCRI